MTHEFKKIIEDCLNNQKRGVKSVLATVVALDGSSYRQPGVRMLIAEDGKMTGAVSGGCVEKEVLRQSASVFSEGKAKVMTYDGRYRLGCEGVLYILIELFEINEDFYAEFSKNIRKRKEFLIESYFEKKESESYAMGSVVLFNNQNPFPFSSKFKYSAKEGIDKFKQLMDPLFRIIIIGTEHDAAKLCKAASFLGWEVILIASPKDQRTEKDFPEAEKLIHINPEEAGELNIDSETAIVLMNHNYAADLNFLLALKDKEAAYIGLLGPAKRREKLFEEMIEYHPEITSSFLEKINGPAGLNIGAESPEEIAVSILSEILATIRKREHIPLKEKAGKIHL